MDTIQFGFSLIAAVVAVFFVIFIFFGEIFGVLHKLHCKFVNKFLSSDKDQWDDPL
jgi:hypothetical protein